MRPRPDMDFQTGDDRDEHRPDHFIRGCALCLIALVVAAIPIAVDVIGELVGRILN